MKERPFITIEEKRELRFQLESLWEGDVIALGHLKYIFHTFRRWQEIFSWLMKNQIKGHKIREFFGNESKQGGLMEPVRKILERVDREKLILKKHELKHARN